MPQSGSGCFAAQSEPGGLKSASLRQEPLPDAPDGVKHLCAKALELPRLTRSEFLPQNERQIERGSVHEQALLDVSAPPKVAPPHRAGLIHMREGSLRQFTADLLQPF